jgi:hypothetical protein
MQFAASSEVDLSESSLAARIFAWTEHWNKIRLIEIHKVLQQCTPPEW